MPAIAARTTGSGAAPACHAPTAAHGTTHNKLFNSLLTAVGVRGPNGAPIENFGDPSLTPGVLTEIHA